MRRFPDLSDAVAALRVLLVSPAAGDEQDDNRSGE